MNTNNSRKGTLFFTLWGIPVSIDPSSWVVLALLGGGLGISSGTDLLQVAIFVAMGMLSLLAHEMGHALMGRRLTGQQPIITIAMMGGLTILPCAPYTRRDQFLFTAAGPLGGLALGLIAAIILGLHVGDIGAGISFYLHAPFGAIESMSPENFASLATAVQDGILPLTVLKVYEILMLICMWWSIFNLLPVLPLDGGHLLYTLTDNIKLSAIIGLVVGGCVVLYAVTNGMWFMTILMGYLTYLNWQYFRG